MKCNFCKEKTNLWNTLDLNEDRTITCQNLRDTTKAVFGGNLGTRNTHFQKEHLVQTTEWSYWDEVEENKKSKHRHRWHEWINK